MFVHQYINGKFVRTFDSALAKKVEEDQVAQFMKKHGNLFPTKEVEKILKAKSLDALDRDNLAVLEDEDPCPTWFGNDSPYGVGKVANQDDISKGETYGMGEHHYLNFFTFEGNENVR